MAAVLEEEGRTLLWIRGGKAICLRTLCHYYSSPSWLQYAYHPLVAEEFRKRFGRDPEPRQEDYVRIRTIRGEASASLLEKARAITRERGEAPICLGKKARADLYSKVYQKIYCP